MSNHALLSPPLVRIREQQFEEPKTIADVQQLLAGRLPSDVLYGVLVKVHARSANMSLATFMQHATGLSRSQLRIGVRRRSTLERGTKGAAERMREQLRRRRWKSEEITELEEGLPSARSDFPAGYADWTYAAFYGFGGGEEVISYALEVDRLIWDLDRAYRDGEPPAYIAQALRDSSVFDAEHFDRPEGQLVKDYSERQAIADLASVSSWNDAMPLIAIIGVHCQVSLLAMFDIGIQKFLGADWSDAIDGSVLTRLFPLLSPRASTETKRPTRRGLVELPVARLLDFSVRLIYRWRNGKWPRNRPSWKIVAKWTKCTSEGLLAQWRSGQKLMTAADFVRFWEEASKSPKCERRTPPVPMPLYLAAVWLETYCVTWERRGKCRKVLLFNQDEYNARRERLLLTFAAGVLHQAA